MRASLIVLLIVFLAAGACATAPRGPFFGDEKFLVLGVEPGQEAEAIAHNLGRAGYRVGPRFRGKHFAAIGFSDRSGRALGVRVVTGRGIALSLHPVEGDVFTPAVRYRLLEPPRVEQHDADGDGFEEVFVERFEGPVPDRCVLAFRVRDSGFVDPVAGGVAIAGVPRQDEPLWLEPYFCPGAPQGEGEGEGEGTSASEPADEGPTEPPAKRAPADSGSPAAP